MSSSDGPNKSKGGLWMTAPDSYAVASVTAALEALPLGRISAVLEGPTSYHIVRVKARRPAGPASFGEVQDKIQLAIRKQKIDRETSAFLTRLRKPALVWTDLDDPNVKRLNRNARAGEHRVDAPQVRRQRRGGSRELQGPGSGLKCKIRIRKTQAGKSGSRKRGKRIKENCAPSSSFFPLICSLVHSVLSGQFAREGRRSGCGVGRRRIA